MKQEIIDRYQAEASVFSALAHPTRLFVLHQINNASHSVTELAQMAGIDISTMSKHLDLLKRYNIIRGEKDKNAVYYKLSIPCLLDFMKCAKQMTSCQSECRIICKEYTQLREGDAG
ncbi:MAG: metalloregulator ArsR/SmtB family transcription factor [Bacteroidales bacterium]|jgi:ArsR family transcriptional regulator|nr:metalloregulator ArsR/SmtB family transcription factor [Bacteroidales bacterium]